MISFTIDDLDAALKARDTVLADSATFATRRTTAAKIALAQLYATYRDAGALWARASTLQTAGLSTSTAVVNTSIGDVYRVALDAGMLSIADDVLFLSVSTTTFKLVPRVTINTVDLSTTTEGFWENNGEIFLYTKDAEFTAPGTLHFNYWRAPVIDTSTGTNVVDIDPSDFPTYVDSVYSFIIGS